MRALAQDLGKPGYRSGEAEARRSLLERGRDRPRRHDEDALLRAVETERKPVVDPDGDGRGRRGCEDNVVHRGDAVARPDHLRVAVVPASPHVARAAALVADEPVAAHRVGIEIDLDLHVVSDDLRRPARLRRRAVARRDPPALHADAEHVVPRRKGRWSGGEVNGERRRRAGDGARIPVVEAVEKLLGAHRRRRGQIAGLLEEAPRLRAGDGVHVEGEGRVAIGARIDGRVEALLVDDALVREETGAALRLRGSARIRPRRRGVPGGKRVARGLHGQLAEAAGIEALLVPGSEIQALLSRSRRLLGLGLLHLLLRHHLQGLLDVIELLLARPVGGEERGPREERRDREQGEVERGRSDLGRDHPPAHVVVAGDRARGLRFEGDRDREVVDRQGRRHAGDELDQEGAGDIGRRLGHAGAREIGDGARGAAGRGDRAVGIHRRVEDEVEGAALGEDERDAAGADGVIGEHAVGGCAAEEEGPGRIEVRGVKNRVAPADGDRERRRFDLPGAFGHGEGPSRAPGARGAREGQPRSGEVPGRSVRGLRTTWRSGRRRPASPPRPSSLAPCELAAGDPC